MRERTVASAGFSRSTTATQRKDDRFDYWRSLFPSVVLEPIKGGGHGPFSGELVRIRGSDGSAFAVSRYDATLARFQGTDSNFLLFTAGIGGTALAEDERGSTAISAPGSGVVVIDGSRPVRTKTRNVSQLTLVVPRHRFFEPTGDPLQTHDSGVFVLPEHGVTKFLLMQMQMLAREANAIDDRSAHTVLRTMVDLAVASVVQAKSNDPKLANEHEAAVFAAACRFIDIHFGEHDLTAARIADEIGCSRAQIFRVFERRGVSLGGTIRQSRLERAREFLAFDPSLSVEQIAFRCGYSGTAAFSRAFKEVEGHSPTDFRKERQRGTTLATCSPRTS